MSSKLRRGVDRALCLLAEVHAGEGLPTLQRGLWVFLLLCGYYVVKPVREELILSARGGAEFKAYAAGASALLLLVIMPAYEGLSRRLRRDRLVALVSGFFTLSALAFYGLLGQEALRGALGIPFYLWASTLGVVLVAQFWSLMSDVHNAGQGLRLFVILGFGQSLGAVCGSKITGWLLSGVGPWPALTVPQLLLVSAGLLALATLIAARSSAPTLPLAKPRSTATELGDGALSLLRRSRYVALLCGLSLLFTLANSNGEYVLSRAARALYETLPPQDRPGFFASFYGDYYFYVNLISLLLQGLLVSRVVRLGGVGSAVMALPLLALAGSVTIAAWPVLAVIRVSKVLENAVDYSLHNTGRQMLWLPTSPGEKYRAKYLVDTVMVRLGDVASSVAVWMSTGLLPLLGFPVLSLGGFALVNALFCGLWLVLALSLARAHRGQLGVRKEPARTLGAPSVSP